jgi:hypothetical protein
MSKEQCHVALQQAVGEVLNYLAELELLLFMVNLVNENCLTYGMEFEQECVIFCAFGNFSLTMDGLCVWYYYFC